MPGSMLTCGVLHESYQRKSRMVEISLFGSGEGPVWVTERGYSTTLDPPGYLNRGSLRGVLLLLTSHGMPV